MMIKKLDKNYVDQELGKTPETERRFYQRLRDTPKVKEYENSKERGFKGIQLKNLYDKPDQNTQTQLTPTPNTIESTENSNSQKT